MFCFVFFYLTACPARSFRMPAANRHMHCVLTLVFWCWKIGNNHHKMGLICCSIAFHSLLCQGHFQISRNSLTVHCSSFVKILLECFGSKGSPTTSSKSFASELYNIKRLSSSADESAITFFQSVELYDLKSSSFYYLGPFWEIIRRCFSR